MSLGASGVLLLEAFAAAALLVLLRPAWLVPAYLGLVWASLPSGIYGGLPSPVEAGAPLLLAAAAWRAPLRPGVARPVFVLVTLLALAALGAGLLSGEGSSLPVGWLLQLSFLFIAALLIDGEQGVRRTALVLCAVGVFLGAGAVHSVVVGPSELFPLNDNGSGGVDPGRAAGPFGESNFFALSLAALAPFAVYVIARGGAGRLLGLLAIAGLVGGVVAADSRSGMLALVLGLSATWLALSPHRARTAALIAVLIALSAPLALARFTALEDRPVGGRANENLIALAMFADRPLTGVGNDNYEVLYRTYSRELGDDPRPVRAAHSLPLEIAAEQGLAGLVAWLAAGALVWGYAASRRLWELAAGRAALLALATYLFGSLFLQGSQLRLLFILAGLVLALGAGRAPAPTPSPAPAPARRVRAA